MISFKKSQE